MILRLHYIHSTATIRENMANTTDLDLWQNFHSQHQNVEFVWLLFTTYIGTNLIRMVPKDELVKIIEHNRGTSVPNAVLHILPHDGVATGGSIVGSFHLQPDARSLFPHINPNKALIMANWVDKNGQPLEHCARTKLENLVDLIERHGDYSLLIGFELEFCLLRQRMTPGGRIEYEDVDVDHSWCSMNLEDQALLDLLEEAVTTLKRLGIRVQQFHGELAPGQWEFALPPDTPLKAIDSLIIARRTVMEVAQKYGYRATLHPRLNPNSPGTGSHVHISLKAKRDDSPSTEPFFAGILDSIPAIAAFTLSQNISYERVAENIGSGGIYVAWGWENRGTILRRIDTDHFEFKMLDGISNPYLGLCAIFSAGLEGLTKRLPLKAGPCSTAPGKMSDDARAELGISRRIPRSLTESLEYAEKDQSFLRYMGESMVMTYLAIKKDESKVFQAMADDEVRTWFISKY